MAAEDIQSFVDEIREITSYLRDLTRTVAELDSEIIKKFGLSVKNSTKEYDRNTQALKANTGAVEKSNQLVDRYGKAIKSATQQAQAEAKTRQKSAAETRRDISEQVRYRSTANELFREFGEGVSATSLLRRGFENLGGDSLSATASLKLMTASIEGLVNATTVYGKALYAGERGAMVGAKAFSSLVQPLSDVTVALGTMLTVLSIFGPGGIIAKGLRIAAGVATVALGKAAEAYAKFNELGAAQADRLFKSFNDLSSSGINLTGGFRQVLTLSQQLGMSVAEVEEFNKLLADNTKNLSLFGGTAAQGAERFAQAAGTLAKEFGEELNLMGINNTEQRELAMGYMNIQARTGQLMNKSVRELAVESAKYVKELDMLAELTGTTRKEQQSAREAALAETRFRAARIEAERTGDTEQLRRLAVAERAAAIARSAGDVRGFTGILQQAAGRGALTTPEAVAAEMTYRMSEILAKPNVTDAELMAHMGRSVELQQGNLAGINAMIGNLDVIQTDLRFSNDLLRRNQAVQEAAAKAGFTGPEGVTKFLQTEAGKRMLGTPEQRAMVGSMRLQQNAAMMMDTAVDKFNNAVNINERAAKMFENAVRAIPGATITGGGYAGGAAAGPGGIALGGNRLGPAAARKRSGAPGAAPSTQGLRLKSGEAIAGGESSPKLIALAHQIQNQLGGDLVYFSALNDTFDRGGNSKHPRGMALDFTVKYPENSAGYADYARELLAKSGLKGRVIDEYLNPSKSATGGHIHVELDEYRFGGVASGPRSGYTALLHGTEAVVPLPDGRTIPVKMDNRDINQHLERQVSVLMAQVSKMDEMIGVMRENNSISSKILQVSRN